MRKFGICVHGENAEEVQQNIALIKASGFEAAFTGANAKDIMVQNTILVLASGLELCYTPRWEYMPLYGK